MKRIASIPLLVLIVLSTLLVHQINVAPHAIPTQPLVPQAAFFGWYKATQMPATGWDLLQRTINWATAGKAPDQTKIVFFTYDGTVHDPPRLGEEDSFCKEDADTVYCKLTDDWEYNSANIFVKNIEDAASLPSTYYRSSDLLVQSFDLVIYWFTYGYDSTNIVNSGVPFITCSTMQTDEMGIGIGDTTLDASGQFFGVVGMAYPTKPYSLGLLTFESPMWYAATKPSRNGVPLVEAGGENATLVVTPGPLQVSTNKVFYALGEQVAITVNNIYGQSIDFTHTPKVEIIDASGSYVWPNVVYCFDTSLSTTTSETYLWDQRAGLAGNLSQQVPFGEYTVVTVGSNLPEQHQAVAKFTIRDIGYWIVIGGCWELHQQFDYINPGADNVVNALARLGYTPHTRIRYLNTYESTSAGPLSSPNLDAWATFKNITDAFTTWAFDRVNMTEPLFVYFFDHGSTNRINIDADVFTVVQNEGYRWVEARYMDGWLNDLQTKKPGTWIYMILSCCESGSFITQDTDPITGSYGNTISGYGRVVITSTQDNEGGSWSDPPYYEKFANPFWLAILSKYSLLQAFNSAVYEGGVVKDFVIQDNKSYPYHPWLDDNADFAGSRGKIKYPVHLGFDGYWAQSVFVDPRKDPHWFFPWTPSVVAAESYSWPPPATVTLWVQVENNTLLTHVQALMLPPDWVPPSNVTEMALMPLESFEMTNPAHDGNWTVSIPAVNFTNHADGPSNFGFMITVQDANNDTAIPRWTNVEFTQTGLPSLDSVPPSVDIARPTSLQIAQGIVTINGTVMDNVCLQKVEVYLDDSLLGTVNLTPTSSSFFELDFNTTTVPNGLKTIRVKAFDTSNNTSTQTTEAVVANPLHNTRITNVTLSKTVVGQGYSVSINVTTENQDEQTQTFQVTTYSNTTIVQIENVTLTAGKSITVTFTWNTTGFGYGNYTLSAHATPVPGETDTTDNTLSGRVYVGIPGDVNTDGTTDIRDIAIIALAFGSSVGTPRYDPIADIDCDAVVDIIDMVIAATNFGKTY